MKADILKTGNRSRRVRAGKMVMLGAALVAGAFVVAPASAGPLDLQLPPLPLPLPTLSPTVEVPVTTTIDTVTKTVTDVTGQLGTITGGGGTGGGTGGGSQTPAVVRSIAKVDSWSLERMPGLRPSGAASETARTTISSTRLGRSGTYTSLIGNGIRATAGRAAALAGPLAAPIVLAMFAIVLLAIAARGPGKLAKVDEDRQAFRERRNHRL
jgi:hypothetical protein